MSRRVKMKTDKQLQQDVLDELNWDPSVNAAHIGIEVNSGVVTLAGHVNSFAEKHHAERATQRVAGVKAVTVEMDINLPGISQRNDIDIAISVENALKWLIFLPAGTVKIKVENGVVTLSGEVEWEFQRLAAGKAVCYVTGVKSIINLITITPRLTSQNLRADIENALKRQAYIDAGNISIEIKGSTVSLMGKVHSLVERGLVRNTVWKAPGVNNIVDNLKIE